MNNDESLVLSGQDFDEITEMVAGIEESIRESGSPVAEQVIEEMRRYIARIPIAKAQDDGEAPTDE